MEILPKTPCAKGPAGLFTGGIRTPLADTKPADRAGLLSTVYLISYSGAAIPAVTAGRLTSGVDLCQILLGYAALAAAASVIALVTARTLNASNPSSGTR